MSAFLSEILSEDNKDFSEKIELIKKKIAKLKSEINIYMKDKYTNLEPNLKPDEILVNESEKLLQRLQALNDRIDEQVKVKLISSSKELQNLSLQMKEYNYSLSLSGQLLEIHRNFKFFDNYKINNDKPYTQAAMTLVKLHSQVIEESLDIQQLNIYESLKAEYYQINDNIIEELNNFWQENIFWDGEKTISGKKSLQVRCNPDKLLDIIQALEHLKKLNKSVESLSSKLFEHFIDPIIHSKCTVNIENHTFSLEVLDKKQFPKYKSVLKNLQLLFQFLDENFNLKIEDKETFITRLSNYTLKKFSDTLSNDCISKVLPTSTSELDTFQSTLSEIEDFQSFLLKIGFINDEQKFLSKYTENVDNIYIDKKCEKLLEIARTIMKKDLHDTFCYKSENVKEFSNNDFIDDSEIVINRKLSKFTFNFPECQISKSAQELLSLVEEILEEACHTTDRYISRLFYTSRNIFEMYAALVPEIHRSFLETIPQQVALFHNNCFYLAHHLLILAEKYRSKLKIISKNFSMIYVDQILLLRQVGSKYFLNHMKFQRDLIFEILRDSGLSSIGHMPSLPDTTERAFRQCIRQLELLKTIWKDILPIKVYCRTIGCLVNDMVEDICLKIVKLEDIPADVASDLVTLFNMVIDRIPKIFSNLALIEQYVKRWRRLKEVTQVLGASLFQIEERWADGKGPLALELSPQEVKQLIRALFQNTERRSNLLSKIRDK